MNAWKKIRRANNKLSTAVTVQGNNWDFGYGRRWPKRNLALLAIVKFLTKKLFYTLES